MLTCLSQSITGIKTLKPNYICIKTLRFNAVLFTSEVGAPGLYAQVMAGGLSSSGFDKT